MTRRFDSEQIVVASHNAGKVREIADLLNPLGIETISANALGLPEPEETGTSFAENAALKAKLAAQAAERPALADDSGLCVDALDGAPGLFSARWAGPGKDFGAAMERVERELTAKGATTPKARRAHFVCALSVAWPDGHVETVEGRVYGSLVWPGRGARGFGYDPVFLPDGENETFGEMDPERKHAMSHRARAFAQLLETVFDGPRQG